MGTLNNMLKAFADTYQVLLYQRKIRFNPSSLLITLFLLSFTFSFCSKEQVLIAGLLFGILAPPLLKLNLREYYLELCFLVIFVLLVSLPKIVFALTYNIDVFSFSSEIILFMLRVLTASTLALLITAYMGYWNVIRGLRRLGVPGRIVGILLFMALFIIRLIRWCSLRVLGRYSRIYVGGLRREWRVLSSVLVDMFLNSHYLSKRYYLGFVSRNLNIGGLSSDGFSSYDLLLIVIVLIVVLVSFW